MRLSSVFSQSFLDGFTMAGFPARLRRPGAPDLLFPPAGPWLPVVFEPSPSFGEGIKVEGDLRGVPVQALHAMMDLLKREDEDRKTSPHLSEKAMHGASR